MKQAILGLFLGFVVSNVAQAGNLIIMRHGEAKNNILKIYNADASHSKYKPMPLTKEGRRQALNSGKNLSFFLKGKGLEVSNIFTSPLPRAKKTAYSVSGILGRGSRTLELNLDILENKMGSLEGESVIRYPWDGTNAYGAESIDDVKVRVRRFLMDKVLPLVKKDATVLVVSHGTPCKFILDMLESEKTILGNAEYVYLEDVESRIEKLSSL